MISHDDSFIISKIWPVSATKTVTLHARHINFESNYLRAILQALSLIFHRPGMKSCCHYQPLQIKASLCMDTSPQDVSCNR